MTPSRTRRCCSPYRRPRGDASARTVSHRGDRARSGVDKTDDEGGQYPGSSSWPSAMPTRSEPEVAPPLSDVTTERIAAPTGLLAATVRCESAGAAGVVV